MQPTREAAVKMLRLSDQDYFQFGEEAQSRIQQQLIVMNRYEGTALGGPSTIDVGVRESLPVLWATRMTNLRRWQVVKMRNSTVIVSDRSRGKITVHDAFFGPKKIDYKQVPKSANGNPKDVPAPKGATATAEILNLKEVANLPWQPGRFAITLIIYDWVSNTVNVELKQHGQGLSPEQEKALRFPREEALRLMTGYQGMNASAVPELNFVASEKTPKVDTQGVALSVPTTVLSTAPHWLIHGAGKTKLATCNLVDPAAPTDKATGQAGATIRMPNAMVRFTLLIAQLDSRIPRQIDIQVPVFSQVPPKAGDVVDLAFHIDIKTALHSELAPATYQIYVVADEHVAGPYPLTVTSN